MTDERVTILGAGIVGICCALSLQERGINVRLIDRAAPGQATSYGNAGVISPWSFVPQAMPGIWKAIPRMLMSRKGPLSVRASVWPKMIPWGARFLAQSRPDKTRATMDMMQILSDPSVALYRRHLAGTGREDLLVDSMYVHAFRQADRASLSDLGYAIRREKGAELELLGADALHQLEPALSKDFKAAVLIKGQARARAPGEIGRVLAEKAAGLGAEIVQGEVTALTRQGPAGWRVITTAGSYDSAKVIVSAGVWSAALLNPLGLTSPLMVERGYHDEFPKAGIAVENSIMDVDAKVVASAMEGGVRVAGTSEFGPIDAPPDPRKQRLLTTQAKDMFPDLATEDVRFWMGRRPSYPDSLPALGEFASHKGLIAAFGHCHYGLLMAPKTGELVADLVTGITPNVDLSPVDPLRF